MIQVNGSAPLLLEGGIIYPGTGRSTSFVGDLFAVDGRIVAVGPELGAQVPDHTQRIDASGHLIVPGLINSHCHAAGSLFRGLVENLPLEQWLQTVWTAERAILTAETTRLGAELGFAEQLLSGVTSVMDMFWFPEEVAEAAKAVGIRCATGGIFFDPPGMDKAGPDGRVAAAEAFYDRYADDPMIVPSIMPHGSYTVGPDSLRAAGGLADAQGSLFSTHAAETREEQRIVQERYGTSVIRHLDDLGLLGPKTTLAHCVHLDAGEIDILQRTGAHASHNPLSNLKLGSGIAPIPKLLDAGVSVTLGTDGPVSGNDLDMWLAMRLAATLHKGVNEDATLVTTDQVLNMVWKNGAACFGLSDQIGSLEAGKAADMVMICLDRPHAVPLFDVATHLVFGAGRNDIRHVWVRGEQVVRDRQLTRFDLPAALNKVEKLQPSIAAAIAT